MSEKESRKRAAPIGDENNEIHDFPPSPDDARRRRKGTSAVTDDISPVQRTLPGEHDNEPLRLADITSEETRERFYSLYGFLVCGSWRDDIRSLFRRLANDMKEHPILARIITVDDEYLLTALLNYISQASKNAYDGNELKKHLDRDADYQRALKPLILANPHALLTSMDVLYDIPGALLPFLADEVSWVFDLGRKKFPNAAAHYELLLGPEDGNDDSGVLIRRFYELYPAGLVQGEHVYYSAETPLSFLIERYSASKKPGFSIDLIKWMTRQNLDVLLGVDRGRTVLESTISLLLHGDHDVWATGNDDRNTRALEVVNFLFKESPESLRRPLVYLRRILMHCNYEQPFQDLALKVARWMYHNGRKIDNTMIKDKKFFDKFLPLIEQEDSIIQERSRMRKTDLLLRKNALSTQEKNQKSGSSAEEAPSRSQQWSVSYSEWVNARLATEISHIPRIKAIRQDIIAVQREATNRNHM